MPDPVRLYLDFWIFHFVHVHHLTRDSQRDPEGLLLIVAMLTDPDAVEVEKKNTPKACKPCLGGGLKYVLCSPLLAEDSHLD